MSKKKMWPKRKAKRNAFINEVQGQEKSTNTNRPIDFFFFLPRHEIWKQEHSILKVKHIYCEKKKIFFTLIF